MLGMKEMQVRPLGREYPLENKMATGSSILAWRIWWTKETGELQSKGSQRTRHDRVNTTAMIPTTFHSHVLPSTPGEAHQFQDQARSSLTDRRKSLHLTQSSDCKHTPILVCAMGSVYSPRISSFTHIYNLNVFGIHKPEWASTH